MDIGRLRTRRERAGAERERGAVLVEFALVVVLFVALLYGLIAFGMALALKQSMTNAASEGARTAVGAAPEDRVAIAEATIEERLGWLGDKLDALAIDARESRCDWNPFAREPAGGNPDEDCLWVDLVYRYENRPLVPALALPGFGYLFPETIHSNSAVQMPPASS